MERHLIISFSLGLLSLSLAPQIQAQEKKPQIVAKRLLYQGGRQLSRPVLSDSTNSKGKTFELSSLIDKRLPTPETGEFTELVADSLGYIKRSLPNAKTDSNSIELHHYALYLLPENYTTGQLSVESNARWELFVDGKSWGKGSYTPDSVDLKPYQSDLKLSPRRHTAILRLTLEAGKRPEKELRVRLGFTPHKAGTTGDRLRLETTPKRYTDIEHIVWSEGLTGTRLSPSGQYHLLYTRDYNTQDRKAQNRTFLYKGKKLIQELAYPLSSARWMPASDRLYYTASDRSGRNLLAWNPSTGHTDTVARSIPEGSFSVSPQERSLIYTTTEQGKPNSKTLDRYESASERIQGYRDSHFISLYSIAEGTMQPLTFGKRSTYLQDISSDESRIIFSVSTPTPSVSPFSRTDYYEMDLKTFAVDTLFGDTRGIQGVSYTASEGQLLVEGSADAFDYVGSVLPKGTDINTYDTQLFLYDQKQGKAYPLTKALDRTITRSRASRHSYEAFFTAEVGDRVVLYKIDLSSGAIQRLSEREDYVKGFDFASRGTAVSYVGQSGLNADRYYITSSKGREELIYDLSARKLQGVELGTMQDWNYKGTDGTTIQGRFYLPPNFDPKRKYPMLVYYYGGTAPTPRTLEGAYSLAMFSAMGYVVYTLNPSGSTGYGQEFAARHINAWGKRTADEIISAVKQFTAEHSYVDAKRIGCLGASYGGFMTQYLQTQTDIFAAACSHAGISSISSYWGEGYWGVGYSTVASKDSYPWNNPKLYTEQSPLFLADRINTPLLLIHGFSDTNVPVGESWQMFNALRILGKPVEFVGVYGEDHHIADPQKREEWLSAIMAFFAKYLQDDPSWWQDLFEKK